MSGNSEEDIERNNNMRHATHAEIVTVSLTVCYRNWKLASASLQEDISHALQTISLWPPFVHTALIKVLVLKVYAKGADKGVGLDPVDYCR